MELSAGTRLGPYEIVRPIGAGGMGVVYRAKDMRLDRQVAIKVLPEQLRADPERMRRFEQEARTVGGLNHPNLVTLHDVGRHDDVPYLVTELLEGQSLRQKLADGPLPVRDCVRISTDIARGLAAAHGAGIVHRDIKPDNIYVTNDGRVKILDFGIAKLSRGDDSKTDLASADTLGGSATAATAAGVVIGTPGYMAPEQLAGSGDIDARTDVFAFGVVLYEMLARKRPFAADSSIEESYAVVKTPPPALPDSVTPALQKIVLRCLEKRRESRFQAAADLAFALEAVDTPTAPTAPQKVPEVVKTEPIAKPARDVPYLPLAIVAVVGILGAIWFLKTPHRPPLAVAAKTRSAWPNLVEGGPVYHRITYFSEPKWFARFAPDGKSVLYARREEKEDQYQVMRSEIGRSTLAPIAGATGRLLDISPSGELALRQKLKDAPGGVLATLVEGAGAPRERAENVHDATYIGEQLAIVRDLGGAMAIEFPIGSQIAKREHVEIDQFRASRDGKLLAFAEHPLGTDARGEIVVIDIAGKQIARSARHPDIDGIAWSPDGKEVWASTDLGIEAMDLTGKERVLMHTPTEMYLRDVRPDTGRMLVGPRDVRIRAYAHHLGKKDTEQYIGWRMATLASVSRDGQTFALMDTTDENADGYALYMRKGTDMPVPLDHGVDAALAPDGSRAVVLFRAGDPLRVVPTVARGGTQHAIPIGPIERFNLASRLELSADGKRVYAVAAAKGEGMRIWQFDLDGGAAPTPIGPEHPEVTTDDARTRFRFAVSPDGKWIALPAAHGTVLVAASGSESQELTSEHGESPIGFTDDGALIVWRTHGWPRPITRIELAAPHKRSELLPFYPADRPDHVDGVIDGSGTTIGLDWWAISSDLFVLEMPP